MRSLLLVTLVLVGCGAGDRKDPYHFEATIPASNIDGVVLSEGVALGENKCQTEWPKSLSYVITDKGYFKTPNNEIPPLEGSPNTWVFRFKDGDYIEFTTFTLQADSVFIQLDCRYVQPISQAL